MKQSMRFFWAFLLFGLLSRCTLPPSMPPVLGPGQILVGRNETVYSIANKHHISVRALIALNRLSPPYTLREGQVLLLPQGGGEAPVPEGPRLLPSTEPEQWQSIEDTPEASVEPEADSRLLEEAKTAFANTPEKPTLPPAPAKPSSPKSTMALALPVDGPIFQAYDPKGKNGKPCHGLRLSVSKGQTVHAAGPGTVYFTGNELWDGQNIVIIKHEGPDKPLLTAYGPLGTITVTRGVTVKKGDPIGTCASDILYFEVRKDRTIVDPLDHVK